MTADGHPDTPGNGSATASRSAPRAGGGGLAEPDAFADTGRRADQIAEKAWLMDNRRDEVFAAFEGLQASREIWTW